MIDLSQDAVAAEQRTVSMLYAHLDLLIERVEARLAERAQEVEFETGQQRLQHEAMVTADWNRVLQLRAAASGLCFGRLDLDSGETRYIGRINIFDPEDPSRVLLLDWRAPQARPFYLATGVSRLGVRRRRHLRLSGRTVVRVDDELLDRTDTAEEDSLSTDSALLAVLDADRTGRMGSIVATIQAEQDAVIRADDAAPLVVQGAPGTGKTVVALHRAAYLLYTKREQLSRRLVLGIGPNTRFLHYIEDVLPSLGETSIALSTMGTLFPGVTATGSDAPAVVEIKGRSVMTDVVVRGVSDRQIVPDEPYEVDVDGDPVVIEPAICFEARESARRTQLPHNAARPVFFEAMFDALARQVADRLGADVFGGGSFLNATDVADIRQDLTEDDGVVGALDELWPQLSPEEFLADLLGSGERLESAADGLLHPDEVTALVRPDKPDQWTVSDVPLLDEAAELLGHDPSAQERRAEQERAERIEYAEGALDIAYGSQSTDFDDGFEAEIISAFDIFDAESLAERHEEQDRRTPVERALADRTWTYGHVIVDEAQELSPMDWRMLLRRCPTRSMTIVGDTAQTSSAAGTRSWADRFKPLLGEAGSGWQLRHLSVNYRTPAEIMAVAADVLAEIDGDLTPPKSIRSTGRPPQPRRVTGDLAAAAGRTAAEIGGTVAIIAPAQLTAAVRSGTDADATVLSPQEAKGLEFDGVVVVEPARIVSEHGLTDLYIALTRPTRELILLHGQDLPPCLHRLSAQSRVKSAKSNPGDTTHETSTS